jgi:hypothetical protein
LDFPDRRGGGRHLRRALAMSASYGVCAARQPRRTWGGETDHLLLCAPSDTLQPQEEVFAPVGGGRENAMCRWLRTSMKKRNATDRPMNITLIQPDNRITLKAPIRGRMRVPHVSIVVLAALTPVGHDVRIVNEYFAPDTTDEALQHADAVAIGEGETLWPQIVRNASRGQLRKLYRATGLADLAARPPPPDRYRSLVRGGRHMFAVGEETSRGCPFDCEFCSANLIFGRRLRLRPVREIIDEIESAVECCGRRIFTPGQIVRRLFGISPWHRSLYSMALHVSGNIGGNVFFRGGRTHRWDMKLPRDDEASRKTNLDLQLP